MVNTRNRFSLDWWEQNHNRKQLGSSQTTTNRRHDNTTRPEVKRRGGRAYCGGKFAQLLSWIGHFSYKKNKKKNTSIFPYLQRKCAMSRLQTFSKRSRFTIFNVFLSNPRNNPWFKRTFAQRLGGDKWGYERRLKRGWMFSQIKDHFEVNLLDY